MAIFPGGIPSYTDPTSNDYLDSPDHTTAHISYNQEIVAVETKVGVNNSINRNSQDYRIMNSWNQEINNPTYVSPDTFTLTGDQTVYYTYGRKLRFNYNASPVYAYTSSSTYDIGTSSTIVTISANLVPVSIVTVDYESAPMGMTDVTADGISQSANLVATQFASNANILGTQLDPSADVLGTQLSPAADIEVSQMAPLLYLASVYLANAAVSIASGVVTKIPYDTKEYDPNSNMDITTNYRYTVPVNGYYHIDAAVSYGTNGTGERRISIYKNGVPVKDNGRPPTAANFSSTMISATLKLAAADYIEIFTSQNSGSAISLIDDTWTFFDINYCGSY